ncbi:MAG: RNA-binding domain-containing protein [Nitrososphaerota archaeon]
MSSDIIKKIKIQSLCYATEDKEKVLEAINNIISPYSINSLKISTDILNGHYGDKIILIKIESKNEKQANEIFENIFKKMSKEDMKNFYESNLNSLLEKEEKAYIRFDKQKAYENILKICDGDPIRIEVFFKKGELYKFLQKIIMDEKNE